MGGVIAQDGFDYQLWDSLVRLPAWLANPAFESLIFEGLEDLEARFFTPHAPRGRLLERYQAKSGALTPAEVRDVLISFQNFEAAYPHAARVQTLVTPSLPSTIAWLRRDPLRVRRARPFYAPFDDVAAACDARLRERLVDAYGEQLGGFVAQSVEFDQRSFADRDSALNAFGIALDRTLPSLEASPRHISDAFDALSNLGHRSIGVPLPRQTLIQTIENRLGRPLAPPSSFPLRIRSDRNGSDETALEVDASAFSGGAVGYPKSAGWQDGLLIPLDRVARWLLETGISRVVLGGSYRLTTAIAVGWSLRAATGFELEIPTRDGIWATDDRSHAEECYPAWQIVEPETLDGNKLVVSVGVLRDPAPELPSTAGVPAGAILSAHLPEPITSAHAAQVGVGLIKRAVDTAAARLRPQSISLFMAGPAAFAVALGHRWNAMAPTQLHEFLATERRYVPTAYI
ncbi:MAG: SAVED domain-containing protein [Alphaproteobacteria bacterium]|nr:SAVED domain-containing protein [Alphaproteobacteria bacterium]